MNITKEIEERSVQLQNECHLHVSAIMRTDNPRMGYQDATNVWLFFKLAELELRLYQISKTK